MRSVPLSVISRLRLGMEWAHFLPVCSGLGTRSHSLHHRSSSPSDITHHRLQHVVRLTRFLATHAPQDVLFCLLATSNFHFRLRHLEQQLRDSYTQDQINDFTDQPQPKDWSAKTAFEREKAEDNKFEEFQVLENAYRLNTRLYEEVRESLRFSSQPSVV